MKITLDYCDSLAQKYIKKYKLQEYVKYIDYNSKSIPENSLGFYQDKMIALNIDYASQFVIDVMDTVANKHYTEEEYNYTIYRTFIETMYHELEHARQAKILDDDPNEFITKLIVLSYKIITLNIDTYYNDKSYSDCIPVEHSAASLSAFNTSLVFEHLGYHNNYPIVNNLSGGYIHSQSNIISPLEYLMSFNGSKFPYYDLFPYTDLNIYNNDLSELEKLIYGLPINNACLDKINSEYVLNQHPIKIKEYINTK